MRFEGLERRMDAVEHRLSHVEAALSRILNNLHDQQLRIEALEQENISLHEQIRILTLQVNAQYQTA